MNWNIEYSRRSDDFIEEHGIRDKVRESIKQIEPTDWAEATAVYVLRR